MPSFPHPSARPLWLGSLVLAAWLGITAPSLFADAPTRVFVASTGSDANPGSRTAPKRNVQAAHDAVAADGEIVILDTAGYGALVITKSVTVTAPSGVTGFLTGALNFDAILIQADANAVVALHGLFLETVNGSAYGILANSVGTLRVEDCTIRNCEEGIRMNCPHATHLLVRHTTLSNIDFGIYAGSANNTGSVDAVVSDCTVDRATSYGLVADSFTNSSARLVATNCVLNRADTAVLSSGSNTSVFLDACTINGATTAVSRKQNGAAYSHGNNLFTGNGADGTFTGTVTGK